MVRTAMVFARAADAKSDTTGQPDQGTVVMVTSPSPGEGKTTSVANLAAVFAEGGQSVLVIDCDFAAVAAGAAFLALDARFAGAAVDVALVAFEDTDGIDCLSSWRAPRRHRQSPVGSGGGSRGFARGGAGGAARSGSEHHYKT